MPVRPLLPQNSFAPEEINILVKALQDALRELRVTDRNDPAVNAIAKRIITLAQQGERDPVRLCEGGLSGVLHAP